jgi:hypothetical protein
MKKIFSLITAGLFAVNAIAQQPPTPNPATDPSTGLPGPQKGTVAWYRGGNVPVGPATTNNIFGTLWNSPIYTQTSAQNRMKLNGNITYPVGSVSVNDNRNGFLLLTNNPNIWTGGAGLMSATQGAFSLLHLVGDDGGNLQTFGFRTWMRNGITMSNNFDAGFIGVRKMPNTQGGIDDVSDFVINWSDNVGSAPGVRTPDNLVFNFTTGDGSANDDLIGNNLNGRETMRHTSDGFIGIGPRYNNANQPQSTLHQHQENSASSWMQITNQASPILNNPTTNVNGPTAITANDGLRWGIDGSNIGYMYNQENKHLLFSTNHNAANSSGPSLERMRITHIGAPTTPNPGNTFANDLTRVSISHDPLQPIDRPLALLHLGYNTGNTFIPGQAAGTDGWRNWMEVGTLVSRSTDHVFMGLKPNANGLINGFNRQDAVIAWGDDYNSALPGANSGPDKLRIIFTSPTTSQPFAGPGAMSTQDGLEFVRYVPFHNTNLNINDPRIGFGDFNSLLPVGTIDPGNTIEINSIMNGFNAAANTNVTGSYVGSTGASGLRFRDLTSQSTIVPSTETAVDHTKVLSVDNLGNVVLIDKGAGGGTGIGNYCGSTSNPLNNPYEIPMNGFNYNFTTPANTQSSFHLGNTVCVPTLARMNVYNDNLQVGGAFSSNLNSATNSFGVFSNITNSGNGQLVAVQGTANSSGTNSTARGVRGEGIALNGSIAEGVKGIANTNNNCQQNIAVGGLSANGSVISIAGDFDVEQSTSPLNQGVNVEVFNGTNSSSTNFGINTFVRNPGIVNYGGFFSAGSASQNIGVYGDAGGSITGLPASPTQANLAGFFNGDVYISGAFGPSDINLKDNIDTITDALNIIKQLKPKSFDYKHSSFPSMHLPNGKQYGLIAQEVEAIIPELVNSNTQPAKLDSVGNVLIPAVNFKGLEYQQLIPFLIKAIQEQQTKIERLTQQLNSKDSIQDARLSALESAIIQCCSSNSARTANSNINQLDIELSDKDAIVLNQNVPNPFAEQTTITYNVPESVIKAQIIFYNNAGQIIQTVDVKTRGKGKVNVFASDLSSGLYHYTLVADGKVVASKKMVRE